MAKFNRIANGDINRARFVAPTSTAHRVVQAGAGAVCFGIGSDYAQDSPTTGASNLAASVDRPIGIFGDGEECQLEMAATCAAGAELKSDADGKGTPASSTNWFYAIADQACTEIGQKIKVLVMRGVKV